MGETAWNVCHLSTVHPANDVRIYHRECKSLAEKTNFKVRLVAHGKLVDSSNLTCQDLGKLPRNRLVRIMRSQLLGFHIAFRVKASVWHLHDPELLIVAFWLIVTKKTVIWDAHEDYFLQFSKQVNYRKYIPSSLTGLINSSFIQLLRFIEKRCYGVICATPSIALKYRNANTVVVGNEVRIEEFSSCSPKFSSSKLLFTGAPDETQCFREVVDAVSKFPDLILTVAGRYAVNSDWEYGKAVLGNQLTHLGWLSREELAKAINDSFLGFLTYEDVETNSTNSPNKLFEFSAGGLPCISTPTNANKTWVKESNGAYLIDGFTSKDIEKGIHSALNSEIVWENKSRMSRSWSLEKGNWTASEKILIDFYNNL